MTGRRTDDGTLQASAARVTKARINKGTQVGRGRTPSPATDTGWQADAWDAYSLIGELRFLTNEIADRVGQARIYVGITGGDTTATPVQVDDPDVTGVLAPLTRQLSQQIVRLAVGLEVVGEAWLVGVPAAMMPPSLLTAATLNTAELDVPRRSVGAIDGGIDLADIEWRVLSTDELTFPEEGRVTLTMGNGDGEAPSFDVDDVLLVRVWQPHPKRTHEPDSAVRSLLPALRTLIGLDMRTAAQIDSRLAGAGMLIVPSSAQRSLQSAAAIALEVDPGQVQPDQFTEALMEAMVTAVRDRASASALVPIVATVPDDVTDKFSYMDFSKSLDGQTPDLVDQAIRRIALGMNCPPELLLGSGSMNHWGAWLSSIETVKRHIAPLVALICDALTTQYLWPVLVSSLGMPVGDAHRHVVAFDVEHLIVRPDRTGEAMELFDRGIISADAVRREAGYENGDAPAAAPAVAPAVAPAGGDDGGPPTGPGQAAPTDGRPNA